MAIRGQVQTEYAWIPSQSIFSTQWLSNQVQLNFDKAAGRKLSF